MRASFLPLLLLICLAGCGPSAKEKYEVAVKELDAAQDRLDRLRPAYDAAQEKAALKVCKEIAGTTPEETAASALSQLQTGAGPEVTLPEADRDSTKNATTGKRRDELDEAVDRALAAQKTMQETQASVTGPLAKAYETMNKIKTPGTPEHERMEAELSKMPEVESYRRQEKRVESAKQAVEEADAELPAEERLKQK